MPTGTHDAGAIVEAVRAHLTGPSQTTHNRLNAVRPRSSFRSVHRAAMMASRAHAETLAAFLRCELATFSEPPAQWSKRRADVQSWDRLACQKVRKLLRAIADAKLAEDVFEDGIAEHIVRAADEGPDGSMSWLGGPVFADILSGI